MLPSDPSPFTSRLNTFFDWWIVELFYDVPDPGLWYPIYKLWEITSSTAYIGTFILYNFFSCGTKKAFSVKDSLAYIYF